MIRNLIFTIAAVVLGITAAHAQQTVTLISPDAKNVVTIATQPVLTYSITREGAEVLSASPLSMTVGNRVWGTEGRARKIVRTSVDKQVVCPVPRKAAQMREHYNAVTLGFKGYNVEFRAYDDGVAYRFIGTTRGEGAIRDEQVSYRFPEDYTTLTLLTKNLQNWFEENYSERPLSALPQDSISMIPALVRAANCNLVLAESDVHDYANSYLQVEGQGFRAVHPRFPHKEEVIEGGNKRYVTQREDYIVKGNLARTFPWRVTGIFSSENEAEILASDLLWLLSEKATGDYSWIKPGKVLWDWWNDRNIYGVDFEAGINTPTYMAMIDFASEHGIEYLLIDEGWSERNSLLKLNPEVDMPAICAYAQSKGVGIQLWAKWVNVDRELDPAFEMMRDWGVKGVKVDFMDRNDAAMNDFLVRVLRKADQCRMTVDFHGSYPDLGSRGRWPVFMTSEGVLGLEYNKWSTRATVEHDLIIPYLRMWAGPMDYTPGAMLNTHREQFWINATEPMSQGTRAHQMAMYVVYESPLQMLSDSQTKYMQNQECFEFLKKVPTVWDRTVPLFGRMGRNVGVARLKGDEWFVGVMGAGDAQQVEIDLGFLGDGEWTMTAIADGPNAAKNAKDYKQTVRSVKAGERLKADLARGGGFTARFTRN